MRGTLAASALVAGAALTPWAAHARPPPLPTTAAAAVDAMYLDVPDFLAQWPVEALVREVEPLVAELATSMRHGGVTLEPAALVSGIRWVWGTVGMARPGALGTRRASWTVDEAARVGRDDALSAWRGYLTEFAEVGQARLVVVDAALRSPGRAELRLALALAGRDRGGWRRADRGRVRVELRAAASGWRLAALALEQMSTVTRAEPLVEDVGDAWLADLADPLFARLRLRQPAPAPGRPAPPAAVGAGPHGGVAVADVDGDGWDDVLCWDDAGEATLLRNQRGERLVDITAAAGLAPVEVSAALWVDLDNDGIQDLVLGRWQAPSLLFFGSQGAAGQPLYLPAAATLPDRVVALTAADVDRDGHLDLYFARADPAAASTGTADVLLLGDGRRTLHDGTAAVGLDARGQTVQAAFVDRDDDGWPDLLVAAAAGPLRYFHNMGGRLVTTPIAFAPADAAPGTAGDGTWGLTWADLDGDGAAELWLGGRAVAAGARVLNAPAARPPVTAPPAPSAVVRPAGDTWRRWDLPWRPGTPGSPWGVDDHTWGAVAIDLDNDGWLDLVATNGLASARRATGPGSARAAVGVPTRAPMRLADRTLDADRLRQACAGPGCGGALPRGAEQMGLAARQWDVALGNARGRDLEPVGAALGLGSDRDGRAVAAADLDHDGAVDLLRLGAEPPVLAVLRNRTGASRHGVTVRLVGDGTHSNADAIGARLTVACGGRRQVRSRMAASGPTAQDSAALVFGLGDCAGPVDLEVWWPSGATERLAGVAADRAYQWVEGGGLTSALK